ncbi:hypothetical protein ACLBWT_18730 [Paenibacillus sp. D51F]
MCYYVYCRGFKGKPFCCFADNAEQAAKKAEMKGYKPYRSRNVNTGEISHYKNN